MTLTFSLGAATWSLAGTGSLPNKSGAAVVYTAPDRAGSATITAQGSGCTATITLEIIEPSNVLVDKVGNRKRHVKGTPSVGFIGQPYIQPADVSFEYIKVRELESYATGTGCLKTFLENNKVGHNPNPVANAVGPVEAGKGSKLNGQDRIASQLSKPCEGTMTTVIPWMFQVGDGTEKQFATVTQVTEFQADGTATIRKGGSTATSQLNDDTDIDPAFPAM